MKLDDKNRISNALRQYYKTHAFNDTRSPADKEWGYRENKNTTRNTHHTSIGDVAARVGPSSVLVSRSRYDTPTATEREQKHPILDTELVFRVTPDYSRLTHLNTGKLHAVTPHEWRVVVQSAAEDTQRLIRLLRNGLGFTEFDVVFDGDTGFRVHVTDSWAYGLTPSIRGKIAEFVTGNIDPEEITHSINENNESVDGTKKIAADVWGSEALDELREIVELAQTGDVDDVVEQVPVTVDERVVRDAVPVLRDRGEEVKHGRLSVDESVTELGVEVIETVLTRESVAVDPVVVSNPYALDRVKTSVYGWTGFAVVSVGEDELSVFNPFVDSLPDWHRVEEVPDMVEVTPPKSVEESSVFVDEMSVYIAPGETVSVPFGFGVWAAGRSNWSVNWREF